MQLDRRLMAIASASALVIATAVAVAPTAVASTVALNESNVEAAGPIGGGWKEYQPKISLQIQSSGKGTGYPLPKTVHAAGPGGTYDRAGGIEKFRLFNKGSNRVEVRVWDNYREGSRQFEGELKVSAPSNNECAMQIFGNERPGGGATALMLRSYSAKGGTLRSGARQDVVTNIYGKWLRVNVVHDATASGGRIHIYINGTLMHSQNGPPGSHYMKYGIYGTLNTPSAQHEWRNVHFYRK